MNHFLVVFNRATGHSDVSEFHDRADAINERVRLETEIDNPATEIVVIGSPSIEDLKLTHSRYFRPGDLSIAPLVEQGHRTFPATAI